MKPETPTEIHTVELDAELLKSLEYVSSSIGLTLRELITHILESDDFVDHKRYLLRESPADFEAHMRVNDYYSHLWFEPAPPREERIAAIKAAYRTSKRRHQSRGRNMA